MQRDLAPGELAIHVRGGDAPAEPWLRTVLSAHWPVMPAAWRFTRERGGRPRVIDPPDAELAFNISHTPGLAIAVVARGLEIGVDVESVRGRPRPFPPSFFTPRERERLRAITEPERERELLRMWTAKEAYAKARGLGLALPFAKVEVDACTLAIDRALDPAPHRWRARVLALGERHIGTLVVGLNDRVRARSAGTDRFHRTAG